jgi:acetoin utilization deacetylase AcuC-like enzyme
MPTALVSHPACAAHDPGQGHPESPRRLSAILDGLAAAGLTDLLRHVEAPEATRAQLERVHAATYLDRLEALVPDAGLRYLDPDTPLGPATLPAARRAAGAVIAATDAVLAGEVHNAFCPVRPPGHHATPDRAMGFCYYNNIAVGVAHALEAHGLERVAVLDFDVHHGNGTDLIFAQEPRVIVCSVFQRDLYPFGDHQSHSGLGVDAPLPIGAGGAELRMAVQQTLLPALDAFAPEMLFVSAGFDGHVADDLSQLLLRDHDFDWLTDRALDVADQHCHGRLVSSLEGGYALEALVRCVTSHVRRLARL